MLESIIAWSLRHRIIILLLAIIVAAVGVWSLLNLNIDAFPDTTPVQVQINTVAPSLVPEEVERQITFPIEMAMSGIPGLEQMRSISQFGLSQLVLTFRDETQIYFARQLINERISSVELPDGLDRPEMGPVSTGLGEVYHYILVSEGADLTDLRTIQDWTVKPALRPVAGTAEVNSWGGLKKQYQVRLNPVRLAKFDLTFDQVMQAVRTNNHNVGGGNLDQAGDMLLVHGIGRTVNMQQINNIVITAREGQPIRIRDVAEVAVGHEIRRGAVTANGQGEVVLGLCFMLMGESSYKVTSRMRRKADEISHSVPAGARLETVYDRTALVDRVIETVRTNLFEGALLVIAILYIFLGNLRAGLIAAAAIPICMLFAFTGMRQIGIAGSLLSLGAIDFGIVVDSSVVMLESIISRLAHHPASSAAKRLEHIQSAAVAVRTPTVFGQLIIMIVYIPILTLEGVEGKMFRPMALTVVLVLLGSLIASLTLTPVLASLFLPRKLDEHELLLVRIAKRLYRPVLQFSLKHVRLMLNIGGVALAAALTIFLNMGSEFVPRLSEGDLVIGVTRPPGTSLDESIRLNTLMERLLLEKFPDEVSHAWSRQGAPEVATDSGSIESTDMFISLKPRERWKQARSQTELVELMLREVEDIPGQTIWFSQPIEQRINEMISGVRSDVALKLFGDDFDTLLETGRQLEQVLREIPGSADLATEQIFGQPILRIKVDQNQIARYGIPAQTVLDVIESIGGKLLGEVMEGQLRFPLVVRLPNDQRASPESIASIMLTAPSGERIPLSRLAELQRVEGPKLISREWGKRRVTVQCNVRGRDIGSFVAAAQQEIDRRVMPLPDGFRIEWGGQFENMQRAQQRLIFVIPLAFALIAGLLFLTYRNVVDTAILIASVPFACVGGIFSLWLRDMPLSISAAVGFITLSGVSVLNGMVLVSCMRHLEKGGRSRREAIEEAEISCLRTVMMTALVASVGFIPMAFSQGAGAEVQRPLATVVIGGVISSAVMTLSLLPAMYLSAEKFENRRRRSPAAT